MISSQEAMNLILDQLPIINKEKINTLQSVGRILKEPIYAERDQPPFDRVTMDGIAISYEALKRGVNQFSIENTQFAGDAQIALKDKNFCIEIMTGAILPKNTDCIIPIEWIKTNNGIAVLDTNYQPQKLQYIHRQGSDHQKYTEVLGIGHKIEPMDISLILSCGKKYIEVSSDPKICIISNGNELIAAGEPILPHQIRMSNGPAIMVMLEQQGFKNCEYIHLVDDKNIQQEHIKKHLISSDVLILSGGVSMGKADFIPQVLQECGVKNIFHKIRQRPGKPMWFGIGPKKQLIFALPGNPVSTITCCRHYIVPVLQRACGRDFFIDEYVKLQQQIKFQPDLTYFLPVRLVNSQNGEIKAYPVETNTSGDFASLIGTDGYIELISKSNLFEESESIKFFRWKMP